MAINKYFILILYFLPFTLVAQNTSKGRISGKVIDAFNKQPVDYATISLFKNGSISPVNGAVTDAKGNFSIPQLPDGNYVATIDFIGYQRQIVKNITIVRGVSISLSIISLQSLQTVLQDVVVTAKTPVVENRIDKMVYNTANDLTAQGGVALDVLKKVPQVTVDIDGNVELQGDGNIRFLINGKPSSIFGASLTDALQTIPASQIKSIEVITSPGAKYDAEGTGGIINIILKDSKVQGVNGSFNLAAGTRLENGAVNLNARKGNFGAGAYFSGNGQLNSVTYTQNNRQSYNDAHDSLTTLEQQGNGNLTRHGYQTGLNFQWDISKYDNLTGAVGLNNFGNHTSGLISQEQEMPGSEVSSLNHSSGSFSDRSYDYSFGYKKTFKKEDRELEILYSSSYGNDISFAQQEQDYLNNTYSTSGSTSSNPGHDHETDISIDYAEPFSKNFTLETGLKTVIEDISNNVLTDTLSNGIFVPDQGQTYSFSYKRQIYAGYASGSFVLFNKFLQGKAGLRYERTITAADFATVSIPAYDTFAPSLVLQHKLSETQSIKFAYSYRIERPDYADLDPFYNISDPHNISTGNPYLKPEIGHNYELGYNKDFESGSNIYAAAIYRYNTNDIQNFSTYYPVFTLNGTDYNDVTVTQRFNIGSQTAVGVNFFGSVPVGKLNLRTNIMLGDRTNNQPGLPSVTGFAYRANLNASYQFANNLMGEVFGNYNSSQKTIQGTRPAFGFYNIAIRKLFRNKKASLGFTAANPFNANISQTTITSGINFIQSNLREVPYRSFGVTLSYKFGKLEFKKDKDESPSQVVPPDQGN